MSHYTVQYGDSPATIASRFGIHLHQLIEANPRKPVVYVGGRRTWSTLQPGERLWIPVASGTVYPPPPPPSQPWQPTQQWQSPWQQQGWQQPQAQSTWQPPQPAWQQQAWQQQMQQVQQRNHAEAER